MTIFAFFGTASTPLYQANGYPKTPLQRWADEFEDSVH